MAYRSFVKAMGAKKGTFKPSTFRKRYKGAKRQIARSVKNNFKKI